MNAKTRDWKNQVPIFLKKGKIPGLKKQFFFSVSIFISVLQFVLCTNDYNPFQDPSLARAVVISKLQSNDSLEMYSTQIVTTLLTDASLIEQVRVQIDHNRYFKDTIIGCSKFDLSSPVKFDFKVSFYDTGWQQITISTLRKNGEQIDELIKLYCTQPLSQPFVSANPGELFTLETRPVKDANVIYNWEFGNLRIESKAAKTIDKIRAYSGAGNGELWVCDIFGQYSSPHVAFNYSLVDTIPPVIKCINDIAYDKDTIITSDSVFHLLLNITDNGLPTITATIDNQPFSRVETPLFIQSIENVTNLTLPKRFHVSASDMSKNTTEKDFFVKYDSDAKKESNLPNIIIDAPQDDSTSASQKSYIVRGRIQQNLSTQADMVLKIKLNDSLSTDVKNVKVSKVTANWFFEIKLVLGVNRIEIQAFDTNHALICSKKATLIYDGDYADLRPPQIVELSVDGVPVSETNLMIVPCDSSKLRVIAFDDGSGIKQVLVNDVDITSKVSDGGYVWQTTVHLSHETSKRYTIKVIDNSNYSSDTAIDLIHNNTPQISANFLKYKSVTADSTFSELLPVKDTNEDRLKFTKISGPESMKVGLYDGFVTWTPTIKDTGEDVNVQIGIYDGISDTTIFFTIHVKESKTLPLHLKTTEGMFPFVIESNDTINFPILVDSLTGNPPFTFSATTTDGRPVGFNGNQIYWHPDNTDTGSVQLRVVVGDRSGQSVTLYPVIRVIPSIDKINFFCSWTGDSTSNGSLDLKRYGSVADTLKLQIIDQYKQYRSYSALVAYGVESVKNFPFDSAGRLNVVVDRKRKNSGIDSLTITLKDQFSHESIIRKLIDYGVLLTPVIVSPKTDSSISDSAVTFRWTRCGEDSSVVYKIFLSRVDSVTTNPIAQTFDTSVIVRLSKAGFYYAQVVAVKNDTTIRSAIKTFRAVHPKSVYITYVPATFRTFLTVGRDSMNLALVVKNNQGPYTFTKTGSFADKFSIDNTGILTFKPTEAAVCSLEVVVQDSSGNRDTLVTPEISVIPANRPCSLSVDPLILNSVIPISSQAVIYTFTITDPDSFVSEDYHVKVRMFTTETDVKVDSTGKFRVVIDSSLLTSGYDSLRVIVNDKGGFSDTISAKISSVDSIVVVHHISPADGDTVYTSPVHLAWEVDNPNGFLCSFNVTLDTSSSPSIGQCSSAQQFCNVSGLIPGTVYYWRIVTFVGMKTIVGTVKKFIMGPLVPID